MFSIQMELEALKSELEKFLKLEERYTKTLATLTGMLACLCKKKMHPFTFNITFMHSEVLVQNNTLISVVSGGTECAKIRDV